MVDREFFVAYDYGMGGLWGVLMASSREAILGKYPELGIVDERPLWLDDENLARMRSEPLWLDDDPPQGLLKALVADRDRP